MKIIEIVTVNSDDKYTRSFGIANDKEASNLMEAISIAVKNKQEYITIPGKLLIRGTDIVSVSMETAE